VTLARPKWHHAHKRIWIVNQRPSATTSKF
jgi:hypothetical protein